MDPALSSFHPAVSAWFAETFQAPSAPQAEAWPSIRQGCHTLIAAPTGSGKTLAAFLSAIDELTRRACEAPLDDAVHVVYVSPLKALSNDIRINLQQPLQGIERHLEAMGLPAAGIRALVRTGDTPASERAKMTRRPPHILVTTPESLYILLTSEGGRNTLRTARTVIVDEIHAVADDKRGSHLALTLERLDHLVRQSGPPLTRIGLSATQRPIERVARFLVGTRATEPCTIVDSGYRRELDLAVELPGSPLEAVMSAEVWGEIYDRLAELIDEHDTTLIFVNTRRLAERLTRHLAERVGEDRVAAHHGSLAREKRFDAEQRLKRGELGALVATASLELGIDIGSVELVCTIGSTGSIATLLQRIGRSGHSLGGTSKGRLFPTSRDELIECAALLDAIRRDELEELIVPEQPLDILAQQIVAAVACHEWTEGELFAFARGAYPFRDLTRDDFDAVLRMLSRGFATRQGRRGAMLHHDAVNGRLRPRRGARLFAITSGGAIPDNADYRVVLQPSDTFIGSVDEDFAIESLPGDIFQLGNSSWRIQRIESGRVLVEDAQGQPPNIPFWFGEAPSRSDALSFAVSRLREQVGRLLERSREEALDWLSRTVGIGAVAAEQIVAYLETVQAALSGMPSQSRLTLERFFDEAGNQHVVIHSPFGSRLNRAWGLALRKRFCRSFNFELQAAASEDAIVLSLGPTHSYPVEQTFDFLRSTSVRDVLTQAMLDAPMFPIRWRWNAGRALALPRFSGGRRVPPRLQRMKAEDLIAVVFPDQLACLENIVGEREIPDHPLVHQTIRDCLEEAMDIERLESLLREIESGGKQLVVRELREPSPLAHEILNAKPYAFLDDAPLEERRTLAVQTRRWLDPQSAADLGQLDSAAIDRVREEIRPVAETADELHDALLTVGCLTESEGDAKLFEQLAAQQRATRLDRGEGTPVLWVAAERLEEWMAVSPLRSSASGSITAEEARIELVRGRLENSGPVTADELSELLGIPQSTMAIVLAELEGQGCAMQGRFTPGASGVEWCDRRVLARIHRYTLTRLRREIQPVSQQVFLRFLMNWQRLEPEQRAEGPESVAPLLEQLEGLEAPAAAWESEILPSRMKQYDPAWLDALCLSGRFVWCRATPPAQGSAARPIRTTPIALIRRGELATWRRGPAADPDMLSSPARAVLDLLQRQGASFFDAIVSGTKLLRTQVEQALAELVATGYATSDSFTGLRALLTPSDRRPPVSGKRRRSNAIFGMENAGRWSLLADDAPAPIEDRVERIARTLLQRYGVIFRSLLEREQRLPPWRDLLGAYRRLEARGEIRGGRFVDGFTGEQFALPDAIAPLRAARKSPEEGSSFSISAADPVNLTGILTSAARLSAVTANRLLYRNAELIAVLESGVCRMLTQLPEGQAWEAQVALQRRRVPPQLRAYLGRPA